MHIFRKHLHVLFAVLVLLSLSVQGLIPTGYMPVQTENGKVEMVICTSTGTEVMMVDAIHDPFAVKKSNNAGGHSEKMASHLCPYALAAAPALASAQPPVVVAPEYTEELPQQLSARFIQNSIFKSWLSQGPPTA